MISLHCRTKGISVSRLISNEYKEDRLTNRFDDEGSYNDWEQKNIYTEEKYFPIQL